MDWIKRNENRIRGISILIGVIIPIITLSFSGFQYFESNRRLAKQESFKNYHKTVEELGGGEHNDLFVATAKIYELRNYPEYAELSIRLMENLLKFWGDDSLDIWVREARLTKEFLEDVK